MTDARVQGAVLVTDRTAVAVVAVKSQGSLAADARLAVSTVATALGCVQGADVLSFTTDNPAARWVGWAMTRDQRAFLSVASRGQPNLSAEGVQALRTIAGSSTWTWWSVAVTWRGQTRDVSPMIGRDVLLYSWSRPQPANPTDPRTMAEAREWASSMAAGSQVTADWAGAIPSLEAAKSLADASGSLVASLPDVAKSVASAVESLSGLAQAAPWLVLGGLLIWGGSKVLGKAGTGWLK